MADAFAPEHPLTGVSLEITVSVGKTHTSVKELLTLTENQVLSLDKSISDPVDLYIGDRLIARGELQQAESGEPGQLAVRLTEVARLNRVSE